MPPFFRRFAFPFGKFAKKNQSRNRPQKRKIFLKNPHFPPPLNCPRESTIPSPRRPPAKTKPRASGIANRVVPAKKKKIARAKKLPRPRETVVRARKGRIRFSPSTIAPPYLPPAKAQSRNRGIAFFGEPNKEKNRRKNLSPARQNFYRGSFRFGSRLQRFVSKSGINDFSRFSGAADFSAGCSASTRMARLPLL